MPVFKSGKGLAPKWSEMEYFEILRLPKATTYRFDRIGRKEKMIIGKGECCIALGSQKVTAKEGDVLDLNTTEERFEVLEVVSDVALIQICGHWGIKLVAQGFLLSKGVKIHTTKVIW